MVSMVTTENFYQVAGFVPFRLKMYYLLRHFIDLCFCYCQMLIDTSSLERNSSGVELRTLNYENPGSDPGFGVKTLGKFSSSTLIHFTQMYT